MSEIIEKVRQIIIDRSNKFYEETKGTKDEYNLYEEHVKHVYSYARLLASAKVLDTEVLLISALLHDIAMTDRNLDRSKHNEFGAEIAKEILEGFNYPKDKIEHVYKCILNHSSSRKGFRTTKEETVLVDSDCMSHFVTIDKLYNLAHNVMGLDDMESLKFIQNKLTKDYNEMSESVRNLIEDKYFKVMNASSIDEIIETKTK